jgi:hypothetical protein
MFQGKVIEKMLNEILIKHEKKYDKFPSMIV